MGNHIFISYSHKYKDRAYARKLAEHLHGEGFEIWMDDQIDYGAKWPQEIQMAVRSCAAFVVVMTPNAKDSDWVWCEIDEAREANRPLFPLLRSGEVFFGLNITQYVNVTNGQMPGPDLTARLVRAGVPRSKPQPPPPPPPPPRKPVWLWILGVMLLLCLATSGTWPVAGLRLSPTPTWTATVTVYPTYTPLPTLAHTSTHTPTLTAPLEPTLTTTPDATATPRPTASPTLTPTGTTTVTATPTAYVVVTGTLVNVREGPGIVYPIVGQVSQGDELPLMARTSNGWWLVMYTGTPAWISAQYAGTENRVLKEVPIASTIPPAPTIADTATPGPTITDAPRPTKTPVPTPTTRIPPTRER